AISVMPTYGSRVQLLALRMFTVNWLAVSYGSSAHEGSPPGAPPATPTTVSTSCCGFDAAALVPGGPWYRPVNRILWPSASAGPQPNLRAWSAVRITSWAASSVGSRPATRMSGRGECERCGGRPTTEYAGGFLPPSGPSVPPTIVWPQPSWTEFIVSRLAR